MIKEKNEYDSPIVSINNSRSSVNHKFGSCIRRRVIIDHRAQLCATDQDHYGVQRDHKYRVVQRLKAECQQVLYHEQERLCIPHYITDIGLYPQCKEIFTHTPIEIVASSQG